MRLIDADALGIGRCNPDVFPAANRGFCAGWNGVITLIEESPTIDAVPVVRCAECKHCVRSDEGEFNPDDIVCKVWMTDGLDSNDFCSYGERRGVDVD